VPENQLLLGVSPALPPGPFLADTRGTVARSDERAWDENAVA